MQLSVVILNYNVQYFLLQCVDSVVRAVRGMDAEIIVVDNNSPDESCALLKTYFPGVNLIAHPENAGFPKGNNIGVAAAAGRLVLILNPDTVLSEDTLTKAIAHYEQLENPGILGVKLIDGRGNFLPESKRGVPTPFVAFTKVSGLYKIAPQLFGKYYANHLAENRSGEVDILVGAFMLMPRELYLKSGGFDENCFMYSDDIDLSYTVLKSGRKNYYFGQTSVIHYKGESTVKDRKYVQRFSEAMDFFYRKHFRRAPIFDFFMRVGAYFFSVAKSTTTSLPVNPKHFYLISDSTEVAARVRKSIAQEIRLLADINGLTISDQTEIIFDAHYFSYADIIRNMELLKDGRVTFKIAHPGMSFLIGSNSSNDRGTVIVLADHR